jgi:hypothetical protein
VGPITRNDVHHRDETSEGTEAGASELGARQIRTPPAASLVGQGDRFDNSMEPPGQPSVLRYAIPGLAGRRLISGR